jgi:hypothetical protein
MGDVSLPFVPARVLAPDDIGLPYLTGVDNAGLSSHSDTWVSLIVRYARAVRLSEHSDL